MRICRFVVVFLATLLISCAAASAKVSIKNGNFYIGYTDIVYSCGLELKVERVYNSKSAFRGIFGKAWGFEYDVILPSLQTTQLTSMNTAAGRNILSFRRQLEKMSYET